MNNIPYTIIRSNRKNIALIINSEANLIVRAPNKIEDCIIYNYIQRKERWILEKQNKVLLFEEKISKIIIENGESLLYLGNLFTIILDNGNNIRISNANFLIPRSFTKEDVITWLKNEAKKTILERTEKYSDLMGVKFTDIKLSKAKRQWGSCSTKNNLNFSWRLIMCPMAAINYVVIHELSHIVYKNHTANFWARIKTIMPDYKQQQDWLNLNRKIMEII